MNKLIIPFLFIACLFVTACSDDEPKDKTKDIIMSVSEEPIYLTTRASIR